MSTGSPIYLVSACVSGEEFVAAFRRYADRNGLFVPMAEPLPAGRKGRFALTLRDGGVMIEGDAEIVSGGKSPSPVHGRVGMTLKFVEPDELSKRVLTELEKARLAMKPAAPSVPPRPAEIPQEPRPVPPPVAGRIDANNALAECVAIGNVEALAMVEAKPGPKFVVPSIPPVGAPRPHTPSTPPMPRAHPPSVPPIPARPKPPTDAPPAIPPIGKPSGPQPAPIVTSKAPESAPLRSGAATTPVSNPTPTVPTVVPTTSRSSSRTQPSAVVPPPGKPEPAPIGTSDTMLAMRAPHEVRSKITRTQPAVVAPPPGRVNGDDDDEPIEPPEPSPPRADGLVPVPQTDTIDVESNLALISSDTVEIAAVEPPRDTPVSPMKVIPPPSDEPTQTNFVLPLRPPAKPAAKNGAVATEPPAVAPPILPAGARSFVSAEDIEIAEPTELSEIDPEIANSSRRTTIGVAVVPEGVTVLPAKPPPVEGEDEVRDTTLMEAQQPTAGVVGPRTVDGRAPTSPPVSSPFEVQEPTPSGDWTIETSAGAPGIAPVKREPRTPKAAPATDSTKLPTGDWTIALSSDSPDGWTEPSKLEKPAPGPPMAAVASAEPLDSKPDTDRPADESGPKVQIDPTLIQPLTPMPGDDNSFTPMPADILGVPGESAAYPQQHPIVPIPATPMGPGAFPAPAAYAMDPNAPAAMPFGPQPTSTGVRPLDARGSAPHLPAATSRKRRIAVIVVSALLVVAIGVVALIVLGGGKQETAPRPSASGSGSAASSVGSGSTPDAPAAEVVAGSAGSAAAAIAKPVEAIAPCAVAITTVPDGADLVIGKRVVGKSPTTLELPCDVETKLGVRKSHFVSQTKSITPTRDAKPVKIALSRLMLSVKVSSKPPGATVTSKGKSLGVTPMITKLPAFETSTLVFTKDGFVKATQKITPKANNQALQATLQKKRRR